MMADGNEMQYLAVCRAIFKQLPGIRREWQQSWCDDSTDGFRNIGLHFKENAVPGQIVELYRKQRGRSTAPPPTTFWGRMKYIFRQSLRKRCVTTVRPSCIELAVLRQELRGHGGHGQQAGRASQSRERREDGLFHCRQADYRGVHKERLPHAGRLGQPLRHESAIEKGSIGEWALQSLKDGMGGGDTEGSPAATESVSGTVPQAQRTVGKKKIQEWPLADYLKCGNREEVLQCIRRFVSINTSASTRHCRSMC